MRPPFLVPTPHLWLEAAYFLVVVLSCAAIYLKTRELYELTRHHGIRHFRTSFLFLGLSYLLRLLLPGTILLEGYQLLDARMFRPEIGAIFSLAGFTSSVAVLSLLYSALWRERHARMLESDLSLYVLAFALTVLFSSRPARFFLVVVQALLILAAAVIGYLDRKKRHGKLSGAHLVYILLFLFWIANFAANFHARVPFSIALARYAASALLFIAILVAVLRRTRAPRP